MQRESKNSLRHVELRPEVGERVSHAGVGKRSTRNKQMCSDADYSYVQGKAKITVLLGYIE